jgi:hypothetical protein
MAAAAAAPLAGRIRGRAGRAAGPAIVAPALRGPAPPPLERIIQQDTKELGVIYGGRAQERVNASTAAAIAAPIAVPAAAAPAAAIAAINDKFQALLNFLQPGGMLETHVKNRGIHIAIAIIDSFHDFFNGYRGAKSTNVAVRVAIRQYLNALVTEELRRIPKPNYADMLRAVVGPNANKSQIEHIVKDYIETKADIPWISPVSDDAKMTYDQLLERAGTPEEAAQLGREIRAQFNKIELSADARPIASFTTEERLRIGIFIVTFLFGDPHAECYFTCDAAPKEVRKFLQELANVHGLIIPQNIADSATTSINKPLSKFSSDVFFFPTSRGALPAGVPAGSFMSSANIFNPDIISYYLNVAGSSFSQMSPYNWQWRIVANPAAIPNPNNLPAIPPAAAGAAVWNPVTIEFRPGLGTEGPSVNQLLDIHTAITDAADDAAATVAAAAVRPDTSTQVNVSRLFANNGAGASNIPWIRQRLTTNLGSIAFGIKHSGDEGQTAGCLEARLTFPNCAVISLDSGSIINCWLCDLPAIYHNDDRLVISRSVLTERQQTESDLANTRRTKYYRDLQQLIKIIAHTCAPAPGGAAAPAPVTPLAALIARINDAFNNKLPLAGAAGGGRITDPFLAELMTIKRNDIAAYFNRAAALDLTAIGGAGGGYCNRLAPFINEWRDHSIAIKGSRAALDRELDRRAAAAANIQRLKAQITALQNRDIIRDVTDAQLTDPAVVLSMMNERGAAATEVRNSIVDIATRSVAAAVAVGGLQLAQDIAVLARDSHLDNLRAILNRIRPTLFPAAPAGAPAAAAAAAVQLNIRVVRAAFDLIVQYHIAALIANSRTAAAEALAAEPAADRAVAAANAAAAALAAAIAAAAGAAAGVAAAAAAAGVATATAAAADAKTTAIVAVRELALKSQSALNLANAANIAAAGGVAPFTPANIAALNTAAAATAAYYHALNAPGAIPLYPIGLAAELATAAAVAGGMPALPAAVNLGAFDAAVAAIPDINTAINHIPVANAVRAAVAAAAPAALTAAHPAPPAGPAVFAAVLAVAPAAPAAIVAQFNAAITAVAAIPAAAVAAAADAASTAVFNRSTPAVIAEAAVSAMLANIGIDNQLQTIANTILAARTAATPVAIVNAFSTVASTFAAREARRVAIAAAAAPNILNLLTALEELTVLVNKDIYVRDLRSATVEIQNHVEGLGIPLSVLTGLINIDYDPRGFSLDRAYKALNYYPSKLEKIKKNYRSIQNWKINSPIPPGDRSAAENILEMIIEYNKELQTFCGDLFIQPPAPAGAAVRTGIDIYREFAIGFGDVGNPPPGFVRARITIGDADADDEEEAEDGPQTLGNFQDYIRGRLIQTLDDDIPDDAADAAARAAARAVARAAIVTDLTAFKTAFETYARIMGRGAARDAARDTFIVAANNMLRRVAMPDGYDLPRVPPAGTPPNRVHFRQRGGARNIGLNIILSQYFALMAASVNNIISIQFPLFHLLYRIHEAKLLIDTMTASNAHYVAQSIRNLATNLPIVIGAAAAAAPAAMAIAAAAAVAAAPAHAATLNAIATVIRHAADNNLAGLAAAVAASGGNPAIVIDVDTVRQWCQTLPFNGLENVRAWLTGIAPVPRIIDIVTEIGNYLAADQLLPTTYSNQILDELTYEYISEHNIPADVLDLDYSPINIIAYLRRYLYINIPAHPPVNVMIQYYARYLSLAFINDIITKPLRNGAAPPQPTISYFTLLLPRLNPRWYTLINMEFDTNMKLLQLLPVLEVAFSRATGTQSRRAGPAAGTRGQYAATQAQVEAAAIPAAGGVLPSLAAILNRIRPLILQGGGARNKTRRNKHQNRRKTRRGRRD